MQKQWTPADIGGMPVTSSDGKINGWHFPRALTPDEQQQADEYIRMQPITRDGWGFLSADHPFKRPRASFDHLAPDHPWRTGTVPAPIR